MVTAPFFIPAVIVSCLLFRYAVLRFRLVFLLPVAYFLTIVAYCIYEALLVKIADPLTIWLGASFINEVLVYTLPASLGFVLIARFSCSRLTKSRQTSSA